MAIFPAAYDVEIDNTATIVATIASVQIAGTPVAGTTVTATVTTAPLGATVAYQWRLDGAPIDGATAASLAVLDAMDGGALVLRLTPQGGSAQDEAIGTVTRAAPQATTAPGFAPAQAALEDVLTGTPGTWSPTPDTVLQQIVRLSDAAIVATGDGSGAITHTATVPGTYEYRETATTSGGSTVETRQATVTPSEDAPVLYQIAAVDSAADWSGISNATVVSVTDPQLGISEVQLRANGTDARAALRRPIAPGQRAYIRMDTAQHLDAPSVEFWFSYLDAAGTEIAGTRQTVTTGTSLKEILLAAAPAGAAEVRVRLWIKSTSTTQRIRVRGEILIADVVATGAPPAWTGRSPAAFRQIMRPGTPLVLDFGPTWNPGAAGAITRYEALTDLEHAWDGTVLTVTPPAAPDATVRSFSVRAYNRNLRGARSCPITYDVRAYSAPTAATPPDITVPADGEWFAWNLASWFDNGRPPLAFEVLAYPDWTTPLANGGIVGRRPTTTRAAQAYTVRATDREGNSATATMQVTVGPAHDLTPTRTATSGTIRDALPVTIDPDTTHVVRVPDGVALYGSLTDIRAPDDHPIYFLCETGSALRAVKLIDCENIFIIGAAFAANAQVSNPSSANISNDPLLEVQNTARRRPCYVYRSTFRGWRATRASIASPPGGWELKRRANGDVSNVGDSDFASLGFPTDPDDDLTYAYTWGGVRLNGTATVAGCDIGQVRVGITYVGSRFSAVIDTTIHDIRMDATREIEWASGHIEVGLRSIFPLYSGNHTSQEHRDARQCVIGNVAGYRAPRYMSQINSFLRGYRERRMQGWQYNTIFSYEGQRQPSNVDPMLIGMECWHTGTVMINSLINGANLILRNGEHFDRCVLITDPDMQGGVPTGRSQFRFLQSTGSVRNSIRRGAIEKSSDAGDRFVDEFNNYNLDSAPWTVVFPNIFNTALDWDDPRDAVAAGQAPSAARFWLGDAFRAAHPLIGPDWLNTGIDPILSAA